MQHIMWADWLQIAADKTKEAELEATANVAGDEN